MSVLWYRRDLRVTDHVALHATLEDGDVVPFFCLDDRLLAGRHASGPRTQFLLESLADLDARAGAMLESPATAHPGLLAVDAVQRPYTVFTPFHRAWQAAPRRAVLPAPIVDHAQARREALARYRA